MSDQVDVTFGCSCKKTFKSRSALMKHWRDKKHDDNNDEMGKLLCPAVACAMRFEYRS
jgi:hypothetical protein